MEFHRYFLFTCLINLVVCRAFERLVLVPDEPGFDQFLDLLLEEEFGLDSVESNKDVTEDEPVLVGEEWLCGQCEQREGSTPSYSETMDLSVPPDYPMDIQIALSLPESARCVAVRGARDMKVVRSSGSCIGHDVTLSLRPRRAGDYQVVVDAYGE